MNRSTPIPMSAISAHVTAICTHSVSVSNPAAMTEMTPAAMEANPHTMSAANFLCHQSG